MKRCFLLVLVGLLAFCASPSLAKDVPAELLPELVPDLVPLADQEGPQVGPRRDPFGGDWIVYDDGNAQLFFPATFLYARVVFTPNAAFQLQGWRILPLNHRGSQAAFNTYVYSQDDNSNLADRLLTKSLNRLPDWDGQDFQNNWIDFELEEGEYLQFEAGQSFSIVYGVCPGGDQNQNGTGYWPLGDGETQVRRSYVSRVQSLQSAVPTNHAQAWANGQAASDLLVRANGEYQNNFVDLGVLEVFNGDPEEMLTGQYLMLPGTEVSIKAQIANYGQDIDAAFLNFHFVDIDSNEVFDVTQEVDNIGENDTLVVTCDSTWSSDVVGRFRVYVTAMAQDDSNPDNNIAGLDQIFFDPENAGDDWIGYDDNVAENTTGGSEGFGWAAMFNHPGGDAVYWATGVRIGVAPEAAQAADVNVMIALVDLEARQLNQMWSGVGQTDGTDNPQWVEIAIDNEARDTLTFQQNQAMLITYMHTESARILVDGTPPIAGSNNHMPSSMMITFDAGNGYQGAASGDYMIQGKFGLSNLAPAGKLLKIEPDTLDFGDSLALNEYHTIEAMFIAYGADSVNIRNIQIPPALRNYVTVGPNAFALGSLDTQRVTISFRADREIPLNSQLLIASDWQNHAQYFWKFYASTVGGAAVNENVKPGVPGEYQLSQNFPNPFNPTTTINFALPIAGDVTFAVFDINGRQVENTVQKHLGVGYHSIDFDASNLPAGVYTYKLTSGDYTSSMKMALIK